MPVHRPDQQEGVQAGNSHDRGPRRRRRPRLFGEGERTAGYEAHFRPLPDTEGRPD